MSGHGDVVKVIRDRDTRRVVEAALAGGWEWVGYTKGGHVEIRWPENDARLHCGTTPSDKNAWKYFAKDIERISGVKVWQKGNRRASRKSLADPGLAEVEAARRRYAREQQQAEAAAQAREHREQRRTLTRRELAEHDRHVHEIESLMRPGYGR